VLLSESTPIGPLDTAADLNDRLAKIGGRLILQTLATRPDPVAQDDTLSTYARKLSREDARMVFQKPAAELERQIRAFNPWPGSLALLGDIVIKFLAAEVVPGEGIPGEILDDRLTIACGEGALRPTFLQRAGKSPMRTPDFLRGFPVSRGARFF
jgi:methionyl-tRNA formyltransferase